MLNWWQLAVWLASTSRGGGLMFVGLRFGSDGLRFGSVVDCGLDQWVLVDIQSFLVCCNTRRWLVVDHGFGGLL